MTRVAVTLSVAAEEDIREIASHILSDNPAAAAKLEDEIWEALERLAVFPELGYRLRDFDFLRAMRISRRFRRYRIIYRMLDKQTLEIVRVLHSARDIAGILGGTSSNR